MKNKHFLSIADLSAKQIQTVLDLGQKMKHELKLELVSGLLLEGVVYICITIIALYLYFSVNHLVADIYLVSMLVLYFFLIRWIKRKLKFQELGSLLAGLRNKKW